MGGKGRGEGGTEGEWDGMGGEGTNLPSPYRGSAAVTTCLGIRNATHWSDARSIEYFLLLIKIHDVMYDEQKIAPVKWSK